MPLQNSVFLEVGDATHVGYVLSCPGQREQEADPPGPAKGQTGTNLSRLVEALPADTPHLEFLQRGQARITNAWHEVEYEALTGRTEPTRSEVLENANLARLAGDLEGIEFAVICCGATAKLAVDRLDQMGCLRRGVQILPLPHLGTRGISSTIRSAECDRLDPGPSGEPAYKASARRQRFRIARLAVRLRRDLQA